MFALSLLYFIPIFPYTSPPLSHPSIKHGLKKNWPLNPHSDLLDNAFDTNKMKALASFQDLYVGLSPYRRDRSSPSASSSSSSSSLIHDDDIDTDSSSDTSGGGTGSYVVGGGVLRRTAPAVFGLLAAIELHPTCSLSGGTFFRIFICVFLRVYVYIHTVGVRRWGCEMMNRWSFLNVYSVYVCKFLHMYKICQVIDVNFQS